MPNKKFTDFETRTALLSGDYIVGYKADATAEYRSTLKDVVEYLKVYFATKTIVSPTPTPTPSPSPSPSPSPNGATPTPSPSPSPSPNGSGGTTLPVFIFDAASALAGSTGTSTLYDAVVFDSGKNTYGFNRNTSVNTSLSAFLNPRLTTEVSTASAGRVWQINGDVCALSGIGAPNPQGGFYNNNNAPIFAGTYKGNPSATVNNNLQLWFAIPTSYTPLTSVAVRAEGGTAGSSTTTATFTTRVSGIGTGPMYWPVSGTSYQYNLVRVGLNTNIRNTSTYSLVLNPV